MIVIGLDPSLCNLGIAAVDLAADFRNDRIVELQVIRTEPQTKRRKILVGDDDARRVSELAGGLDAAIVKYRPLALVVEAPAGSKGAKAARALGLAIATVVTVARLRGLPLVQVQPLDVKRAMVGRKTAEKDEIILAVERRFPEVPWPDDVPKGCWQHAADAVGAVVAGLDSDALRIARQLAEDAERSA